MVLIAFDSVTKTFMSQNARHPTNTSTGSSPEDASGAPRTDGVFVRRVLISVGIGAAAVIVALAVAYAINIFLLLFAGLLFATFLSGLSHTLAGRTRLSYRAALPIVTVALLLLIGGTAAYLAPQFVTQVSELADELAGASEYLYEQIRQSPLASALPDRMHEPSAWLPSNEEAMATIGGIFSTTAGAFTSVAVILFVGLYGAADPTLYQRGLIALVPPSRRERAREVLAETADTLWWWIMGRLSSMAIIGLLVTIGLWVMGIPVPVALGVLAALLCFIPNIGPLVALIPPTLLALQQGPWLALAVAIFYVVVQLIESYVITPLIQQRSVSLPPAVTLGSQMLLGVFTGILGVALATPLAAVALLLARELYVHDVLEREGAEE